MTENLHVTRRVTPEALKTLAFSALSKAVTSRDIPIHVTPKNLPRVCTARPGSYPLEVITKGSVGVVAQATHPVSTASPFPQNLEISR
jgi:hypothetical protein